MVLEDAQPPTGLQEGLTSASEQDSQGLEKAAYLLMSFHVHDEAAPNQKCNTQLIIWPWSSPSTRPSMLRRNTLMASRHQPAALVNPSD